MVTYLEVWSGISHFFCFLVSMLHLLPIPRPTEGYDPSLARPSTAVYERSGGAGVNIRRRPLTHMSLCVIVLFFLIDRFDFRSELMDFK